MISDNWAICPRCKKKRENGSPYPADMLEPLSETLREDWEIGIFQGAPEFSV